MQDGWQGGNQLKPRVAVSVRPSLEVPVAVQVVRVGAQPLVMPWPRDGKEFRYFLHQHGPDVVVADAHIGAGYWYPVSEWGFVRGVRAGRGGPPDLIGLFDRVGDREAKRARMAGCAATIDLSDEAWRSSLRTALALTRLIRMLPRPAQETPLDPPRPADVEPLREEPPRLHLIRRR